MSLYTKKTSYYFLYSFSYTIGMFCGTPNMYAAEQNKEYYVKAAFLLNFTKFVEWPSHVLPTLLQQ